MILLLHPDFAELHGAVRDRSVDRRVGRAGWVSAGIGD